MINNITNAESQALIADDVLASSASTTPKNDTEMVAYLATLQPLDYEKERLEYAKKMALRAPVLDDLVKKARKEVKPAGKFPFQTVALYPQSIDPAELFNEITSTIKRIVILDDEQADAATLWITHTYLIDLFDVSPIAIINAPEKACAKTLFQNVLARMSYRPLPAANASPSAIFRAIQLWEATLFIDEADTFFKDNPELHGLVNAGYKKGGYVLRSESVGDSFEPSIYSVYSAKCIAGIDQEKHLPDTTMSRGIVFNLRRKLQHETVERFRYIEEDVFKTIASKLVRFASDYAIQVRLARPSLPDALSDRAQDNWESLFAIAECAGEAWVKRALAAALKLSAVESAASTGNELLADIRDVFISEQTNKISTADLITALVKDDEKSWATYNRGKSLTPRQLAKQLAIYGIKSKTVRTGPYDTPKGYDESQFVDVFKRYLAEPEELAQQRHSSVEANKYEQHDVAPIHKTKNDADLY